MGDVNYDGYPEIMVFTQSVGSGLYGNVTAYSSNNEMSWSEVYFPELPENLKRGYMGHDKFLIQNDRLIRRFSIYLDGDTSANPQGGTRQIEYLLIGNEPSRQFIVNRVFEPYAKK